MISYIPSNIFTELLWCLTCISSCIAIVVTKRLLTFHLRLSIACGSVDIRKSYLLRLTTTNDLLAGIISRNSYLEECLLNEIPQHTSLARYDPVSATRDLKYQSKQIPNSNLILKTSMDQLQNITQAAFVGVFDLRSKKSKFSSEAPTEVLRSILDKISLMFCDINSVGLGNSVLDYTSEDNISTYLSTKNDRDLTFYGIGLIKLLPISWEEELRQEDVVIWLSYKKTQMPSRLDNHILLSVKEDIKRELLNLKAYSQLECERLKAQGISEERLNFISHLSHDLRTPLANIQNLFYLLLSRNRRGEEHQEKNVNELLELGINNCMRLNGMLSDILDFTKHQAGRLKASPVRANLKQLIEELIMENSLRAHQQGVKFNLEETPPRASLATNHSITGWEDVFVDIRHLRRILLNLIGNAISHCPNSIVRVSCKFTNNDKIPLIIEDNGPGIPPDRLAQLFSPYTYSTNSSYGLGLALTKGLSELNGIELRITSTVGKGTKAELIIPKWLEDSSFSPIK